MGKSCISILQILGLGMSIANLVLIVKIYNNTGENPLEMYDEKFPTIPDNNSLSNSISEFGHSSFHDLGKYCQCGEKLLNNICTEEQIISGCFDVSKNSERILLRHLEDVDCNGIKADIRNKGGYSKVFDLGFDMVNKMALGILIVLALFLGSVALTLLTEIGQLCCAEGALALLASCAICIICILLFSGLTNFVLFIILMVNYYKGKTTGEFLDFYNQCLEGQEEKSQLKETFDKLNDTDSYMTAFVAINFISLFLNCITSCASFEKKEEK